MNATDLDNMRRRAEAAGDQLARFDYAADDEQLAEAELLAAVIDAVRPALDALSSRIRLDARRNHESRGVHIAGAKTEPGQRGHGCYLLDDGRLMACHVEPVGTDDFAAWFEDRSPDQVANTWDVQPIVGHLSERIDSHLAGNQARRTSDMEARARKLRAIAELLGPRK